MKFDDLSSLMPTDIPRSRSYEEAFCNLAEAIQQGEVSLSHLTSESQYSELLGRLDDQSIHLLKSFEQLCQRQTNLELALPFNMGRYEFLEKIASGGMGVVYRSKQFGLERPVAVKVMNPATALIKDCQEQFRREANLASRLNHPNIVTVFDFGVYDRLQYLVMPLVEGDGLDELNLDNICEVCADPVIPDRWHTLAGLAIQICSAIAYAHRIGVLHGDISPANIVIDDRGKAWVLDFGLSRMLRQKGDFSSYNRIPGTPRYMAPEQLRRQADEKSDVYSLGVVLWELATQQVAWEDNNQFFEPELPAASELKNDIPTELSEIISRACHYLPAERYQSADEMLSDLKSFIMPKRSNNWPMAWAATLLLCLSILAVAIYSNWNQNDRFVLPTAGIQVEPGVFEINENRTVVCQLEDIDGVSQDAVITGTDAEHFKIDNRAFCFIKTPDFEQPTDSSFDNSFHVVLGHVPLEVRVTDVDEPPRFLLRGSNDYEVPVLQGNHHCEFELRLDDPEQIHQNLTIVGGDDKDRFEILPRAKGKNQILLFKNGEESFGSGDANGDNKYELVLESNSDLIVSSFLNLQSPIKTTADSEPSDINSMILKQLGQMKFIDYASPDGKTIFVLMSSPRSKYVIKHFHHGTGNEILDPFFIDTKDLELPEKLQGIASPDPDTIFVIAEIPGTNSKKIIKLSRSSKTEFYVLSLGAQNLPARGASKPAIERTLCGFFQAQYVLEESAWPINYQWQKSNLLRHYTLLVTRIVRSRSFWEFTERRSTAMSNV